MRWSQVCIESIGYALPEERVSTTQLELALKPVYDALHLAPGHVASLTGVRERRFWPPGQAMWKVAARAGARALEQAGMEAQQLGALIYAGVCRDQLEPATACAVAEALEITGEVEIFDLSNACLGVLNGMIELAHRIECGQINAGMVVSAESARAINHSTLERLLQAPTLEGLRLGLATFTGGSGAVAVVLTRASHSFAGHRLLGGAVVAAPQFHRICRWGGPQGLLGETPNVMETDASAVLTHGVALGLRTWEKLLATLHWRRSDVDRVICHQVGAGHRRQILETLGLRPDQDFNTFETLGNMGTVALPLTLAQAEESGFFSSGDRVGLLGIGSGLNCVMLGVHW